MAAEPTTGGETKCAFNQPVITEASQQDDDVCGMITTLVCSIVGQHQSLHYTAAANAQQLHTGLAFCAAAGALPGRGAAAVVPGAGGRAVCRAVPRGAWKGEIVGFQCMLRLYHMVNDIICKIDAVVLPQGMLAGSQPWSTAI